MKTPTNKSPYSPTNRHLKHRNLRPTRSMKGRRSSSHSMSQRPRGSARCAAVHPQAASAWTVLVEGAESPTPFGLRLSRFALASPRRRGGSAAGGGGGPAPTHSIGEVLSSSRLPFASCRRSHSAAHHPSGAPPSDDDELTTSGAFTAPSRLSLRAA